MASLGPIVVKCDTTNEIIAHQKVYNRYAFIIQLKPTSIDHRIK